MIFKDRYDAANQLVDRLKKYKNNPDAVIIAIPRGAVQIGSVLAKELHTPLDIILTKKIGAPGNSEFAIGAVSLQASYIDSPFPIDADYIEQEINHLRELLKKRYQQYYQDKKPIPLKDKIVILIDDGVATGNTLLAALELIRQEKPKKIVVAVPVGPSDTIAKIAQKADAVVCLLTPEPFYAIGAFYQNFAQVDDQEAINLLHEAQT